MRVLLIEDDSATAQSIELMLKSEGFNVYTTDLGEEGIDLGKIYDYDLILLDLNLPDMSGMDVLRQLRVSKINTPIMILSGSAEIDAFLAEIGRIDVKAFGLQHQLDALRSSAVVLDQQYAHQSLPTNTAKPKSRTASPQGSQS